MGKPFDRVAPYYDRWIGRFMSDRMDRMADFLSCSPDEIVLDLGGGTGLIARRLLDRCGEVHLLDESSQMIGQVRQEKIKTRVGCGTETPYPDQFFDAIVLSDVFHHIREQDLLLDEVARLLKPGGRLLVNEVDLDRVWGRIIGRLENLIFTQVFPTGFQSFCSRLEERGFRLAGEIRDSWSFIGLWKLEEPSLGGFPMSHSKFPEDIDRFQAQRDQGDK
jgi:demethylmenaquinone methyltransferase/2-methoxy-6-polyprenyl-1,4-benzoquinol methylase